MGYIVLHNYMLASRAFANVIPLSVIQQLDLNVTRPYKSVFGLDFRAMYTHGLIKDVVVHLVASPDISMIMDIVVVDLPPSYGMLL
jgi:hypothetical protein